jgi:hypothetical protein
MFRLAVTVARSRMEHARRFSRATAVYAHRVRRSTPRLAARVPHARHFPRGSQRTRAGTGIAAYRA